MIEIKNRFISSDAAGAGLTIVDCQESPNRNVTDLFVTPNLFNPKSLVIVKNIIASGSEENQNSVLEFIDKNKNGIIESQDVVVIFMEDGVPKKSNKILKVLEKSAKKQNFEKLLGIKLEQWIMKRMTELDPAVKISKQALNRLIAFVGNDSFLLNNEIQKIVNYCAGRMISNEDIDLLVKANLNTNIFKTIDSLANNNKKEAIALLHEHIQKGDDPFYILSMIVYQFRNLLKVADLKENEKLYESEIVRRTKLHPFVVKKSLGQLNRFSFNRLREIYGKIADLDTAVKTGQINILLAIDRLIAEM